MELKKIIEDLYSVRNLEFDESAVYYEKYRDILKEKISQNSSNVEAYCLLAMLICEYRESTNKSIQILEECYIKNKKSLSDNSFSLWATCMAYFLIEEGCEEESENRGYDLLSQAVSRNSNYEQTYYAFGRINFERKNYEKACKLFHRAFELSPRKEYKYCEAVSHLINDNQREGISLLKSIYTYPFEDILIDGKIIFSLGRELALMGKLEEARKIAHILLNIDYEEFEIWDDDMADFMFILGDYERCVELYDKIKMFEEPVWLNIYFYSLKQINKISKAKKKLVEIIENIEEEINEEPNFDDWENYEDYEEYITSEKNRLEEIKKCYYRIMNDNEEVKYKPDYYIYYECYYINCPRHLI